MTRHKSRKVRNTSADKPENRIVTANLELENARPFLYAPDRAARERMAEEIGADGIPRLRFEGRIQAESCREWRLSGNLRAIATQKCVVSLEPVSCRIRTRVLRRFLDDPKALLADADGEMPLDDSIERLTDEIDLYEIARETLLLELPDYPRRRRFGPVEYSASAEIREPEGGNPEKPFAVLRQLKKNPASR